MSDLSTASVIAAQIKLIRKYLKLKIIEDNVSFQDHFQERSNVYDLMKRSIVNGESHSALIIGPRGCGKTTLVNSVLSQISKEVDLANDAIIVKLNGLVHHDDKIALKSITAQMQLENAVGDRVFGTFAENLSFLLSCLRSADRRCRSMLFVLEEFDMFCHSGRTQTLLYNLFDITHSQEAPMCVLGVTNRIDVMELLEKRVKSRFSHRHIYVLPNEDTSPGATLKSPVNTFAERLVSLLSMPLFVGKVEKKGRGRKKSKAAEELLEDDQYSLPEEVLQRCKVNLVQYKELDAGFVEDWNAHIQSLAGEERVIDALEKMTYYTVNEQIFRNILFQLVSQLSLHKPFIEATDLTALIDKTVESEHRVKMLQSLSILELSLVIAMKHGLDIFDGQPMNFEMVLHRYTKFANTNSSTQSVPRPVIQKAFEHLQELGLVVPAGGAGRSAQHTLCALAAPAHDVSAAVAGFPALPTEIAHWYNNSFQLVSQLSLHKPFIEATDLTALIDKTVESEHRVKMLQSLSILELSLVIAMKHGLDIFDGQPMNFEMVLHRYTKFANTNSSTQSVPRPVIQKAFEHLQELGLVVPAGGAGRSAQHTLCALAAPAHDVSAAVAGFPALPTEIAHWYNNSVI